MRVVDISVGPPCKYLSGGGCCHWWTLTFQGHCQSRGLCR